MTHGSLDPEYVRGQIVGVDATFATPFGERLMVYCDYTASGRCLRFIETYLQGVQRVYANTHTEDDVTGRSMSRLLREAEDSIKRAVNAGPGGRLVACGTGATGAIYRLQQMVGVALPPATRDRLGAIVDRSAAGLDRSRFAELLAAHQPVVFLGPYEHHSNEISWRQSLARTVVVRADATGNVDLGHLEALLADPAYRDRPKLGSFSAASNVTGMRADVRRIASVLHAHGALACFDFAACAPYVAIDMNPEPAGAGDDPSIDAIFVSPHKFVGGPGSSGVLVFNERIYRRDLPPSIGAGGTVDYVGPASEDFIEDIEEREKAGTPGVLQTLKAALVFQVKERVGVEVIERRERHLTRRAIERWTADERIEILGNPDPDLRVGIVSFNVKTPTGGYLHHKFVTALLNDLFGIQSRAGCSCAGPYGHRLLAIDDETSERYRHAIQGGACGIKPGWCRVGFHWVMDDLEADYVIDAVLFIARFGHRFLALYEFDLESGMWSYRDATDDLPTFSLDAALRANGGEPPALTADERRQLYVRYLDEAALWADRLGDPTGASAVTLEGALGELQFFALPAARVT